MAVKRENVMEDYSKSHLHPGKGSSYRLSFIQSPYLNMVWQFEKKILNTIFEHFYKNTEIIHLDFACGTGRILCFLEQFTKKSIGVDLSPSMLAVARKDVQLSEIIEADLTKDKVLKGRRFNLITAFRFFPNAENELRMKVFQELSRILTPEGYLVFNNHKHTGSLRNRLARLFGRQKFKGMSLDETENLLRSNSLEIVKIYTMCISPASAKHTLLPVFLLRPLELFLSRLPFLHDFGENLIYVCRRNDKPQ